MFATIPAKPTFPLVVLAAALFSGCTTTESYDSRSFAAEEIRAVNVSLEKGDLSILGNAEDVATIEARVYGYAGKEEVATRNHDGVRWMADVQSGVLTVNGGSEYERAGVDLDLSVPKHAEVLVEAEGDVDLSGLDGLIIASGGHIDLQNSYGNIQLSADGSIHAEDVGGDLLFAADGSMDVALLPLDGDRIELLSGAGGVELELPFGVPVDLEIWGDPEYDVIVEDLGFGRVATAPGFFSGVAGPGSVRVEIVAVGGPVMVRGSW
jgi:hypothetical protein